MWNQTFPLSKEAGVVVAVNRSLRPLDLSKVASSDLQRAITFLESSMVPWEGPYALVFNSATQQYYLLLKRGHSADAFFDQYPELLPEDGLPRQAKPAAPQRRQNGHGPQIHSPPPRNCKSPLRTRTPAPSTPRTPSHISSPAPIPSPSSPRGSPSGAATSASRASHPRGPATPSAAVPSFSARPTKGARQDTGGLVNEYRSLEHPSPATNSPTPAVRPVQSSVQRSSTPQRRQPQNAAIPPSAVPAPGRPRTTTTGSPSTGRQSLGGAERTPRASLGGAERPAPGSARRSSGLHAQSQPQPLRSASASRSTTPTQRPAVAPPVQARAQSPRVDQRTAVFRSTTPQRTPLLAPASQPTPNTPSTKRSSLGAMDREKSATPRRVTFHTRPQGPALAAHAVHGIARLERANRQSLIIDEEEEWQSLLESLQLEEHVLHAVAFLHSPAKASRSPKRSTTTGSPREQPREKDGWTVEKALKALLRQERVHRHRVEFEELTASAELWLALIDVEEETVRSGSPISPQQSPRLSLGNGEILAAVPVTPGFSSSALPPSRDSPEPIAPLPLTATPPVSPANTFCHPIRPAAGISRTKSPPLQRPNPISPQFPRRAELPAAAPIAPGSPSVEAFVLWELIALDDTWQDLSNRALGILDLHDRGVSLRPEAEAHLLEGNEAFSRGEYQHALACYRCAGIAENTVRALLLARRDEECVAACSEALSSNPWAVEVYLTRSRASRCLHRFQEAASDLEVALGIARDKNLPSALDIERELQLALLALREPAEVPNHCAALGISDPMDREAVEIAYRTIIRDGRPSTAAEEAHDVLTDTEQRSRWLELFTLQEGIRYPKHARRFRTLRPLDCA
eukprot:TRINITY_DN82246_c0_g1_i1.p1 TRINITY_DN82246_c0_g1~~TRINITY_DN82246_c0_g1_i1.p1  ORF type:complete len:859 (+),score=83.12 TRINITY_DN82246_c0_g1_i1:81-2657(+)